MPNPFAPLQDALRVLTTQASVLPATGQAVIDMVSPDIEEIYDQRISGEARVEGIFETDGRSLYRTVRPVHRRKDHALRYFVDGSTKTYFIGTVLEGDRSSPVQLSQVAAAVVHRQADGKVRVAKSQRELVVTLDKSQLSDQLWSDFDQAISKLPGFSLKDGSESKDKNPYADIAQETRARGAHRANWHMRKIEEGLAKSLARDSNAWLVLDGSVGNEFETWSGPPIIGVAKTFRRDSRFTLGTGPRAQPLNLYSLLKDLDENQRTVVFSRSNEDKIVFWYVRIRPQKGLDYPLMGVIKVEMPNSGREPVDSNLVDQISGWLVSEHSVTPYGRDKRWHAHLYPIYLAEQVTHGLFYSDEVLKSGVRWPFPTTSGGV